MAIISINRLRKMLAYEPTTGVFTWLEARHYGRKGKRAGSNCSGYCFIRVCGKNLRAHRIAWALTHGEWPKAIDHRNGDGTDNRLKNLRLTTSSQNQQNKKLQKNSLTGIKGVHFRKERNAYIPRIFYGGKIIRLGYFKNIHEAERAYINASKRLFGEYSFAVSRGANNSGVA